MLKQLVFICICFLLFISCKTGSYKVEKLSGQLIALDTDVVSKEADGMRQLILPYKNKMDTQLNKKIGFLPERMAANSPESLLSNFCADALLNYVRFTEKIQADIAILNFGGLRKPLEKGDLTVRDMFELMPFENKVVVIQLSGKELHRLFDVFAQKGGEVLAGVRMGIADGKSVSVLINNVPLDDATYYTVVTSDYLSEGNDGMLPLKNSSSSTLLNKKMRDAFIEYILQQTAAGKQIQSALDKRVYVVQK
ncbi:MAG: 5'-nucleotidase [Paludibacteraceae bacterium]|nr:5'-nucleotidase [Paludibacteraceae bacterium]